MRGFLRAQELAGDEPALHEITWVDTVLKLSDDDEAMIARQVRRCERAAAVAVHTYLPSATQLTMPGPVNVARAMFETDRMPESWLAPLLKRDEVWVPCRHNLQTFVDSGLPGAKLRVVGGTLDFDLFAPTPEPYPLETTGGCFTFLTNFDFSARKGWDVLLRAWARAFTDDDGVCLVLKSGSFYRHEGYVEERVSSFIRRELGGARLAPIHLLTDLLPAQDMPRLYAAADAYVMATRGEGWGRPFMEAQSMGLPTIASRWGGQLDFMDEDTSWLVDGRLVGVPDDAELFNTLYRGHRWFEPDVDDLAGKLRDIADHRLAARQRAAPARERLIARFGAEAIAATLREAGWSAVERFGDRRRPAVVMRGAFGSTQSLATVNDGLATGLEAGGHVVHHRAPGDDPLDEPIPGISHSWPHDFSPVTEGPLIMIVPWEYGPPPLDWVAQARRSADRVWVPSEYVRERFIAGGLPAGIVETIPNGFDPARFSPDGPATALPVQAGCTFLFVGATIWRKGVDHLIAAWSEAFGPDDDVALVIKDFGTGSWYQGQTRGNDLRRFAARGDVAPVVYLDEDLPARELPALYRACDVLVVPYRGEGFCLPALEAMACGLPVIHTGTGPTAEFVSADGGWALQAAQTPLPGDLALPPLAGEAHVQEVDRSSLVAALRAAAGDPADRQRRAQQALAASARCTWPAVCDAARASLMALEREGLAPARLARPETVDVATGAAVVVYAPDWGVEAGWVRTLSRWSEVFTDSDSVTLALPGDGADPDQLAAHIIDRLSAAGVDVDTLPDLLLCRPGVSLADLVAAASVVLVDDCTRPRPELTRRVPRVVGTDLDSLQVLRAELVSAPGQPVATSR